MSIPSEKAKRMQTGDTMNAELFIVIAVIAIAGMAAAVSVSKRKK